MSRDLFFPQIFQHERAMPYTGGSGGTCPRLSRCSGDETAASCLAAPRADNRLPGTGLVAATEPARNRRPTESAGGSPRHPQHRRDERSGRNTLPNRLRPENLLIIPLVIPPAHRARPAPQKAERRWMWSADGRSADGRSADGRSADGRSAGGRSESGTGIEQDDVHARPPALRRGGSHRIPPPNSCRTSAMNDAIDATDTTDTTDATGASPTRETGRGAVRHRP